MPEGEDDEDQGRALCVEVGFCLLRVLGFFLLFFFVSKDYGLQRNAQGGMFNIHLWYV